MAFLMLYLLLVLGLATPGAQAGFGDVKDHGVDYLFEKMGQARVHKFEIIQGIVELDIALEDTEGKDEVWILDFQPTEDNVPAVLRNVSGGYLMAKNTGQCSSVFNTVLHDPVTGFYKDDYVPSPPGTKALFNSFQPGSTYVQRGDMRLREDHLIFAGTIDTLFNCTNSNLENVWERSVTPDTIQFNTTLYMTNVRPIGTSANPEPSYIQSYAILYWRLLRVALSRFLISSTERLRPIFEYAIVKPVYVNDDEARGFDRAHTEVELVFRTVTVDPNGNLMSVYQTGTLMYEPAAQLQGTDLAHIKKIPNRGCGVPLGVEYANIIPDVQLTSSGVWLGSPLYGPANGRLNAQPSSTSAGTWLAGNADLDQWIQVEFTTLKWVSGVLTQGYEEYSNQADVGSNYMWVVGYRVAYSTTQGGVLIPVLDVSSNPVVFDGNYDSHTIVTNRFSKPVLALIIRLMPVEWTNNIALRFELLGCEPHTECYTAANGVDYRGTASVTETGKTCQPWSSQTPTNHTFYLDEYLESGIGDHNFCRNPSNIEQPWCYALNASSESPSLEFCDVGDAAASCADFVESDFSPSTLLPKYAPYCNYTEWDGSCTQRWMFNTVLEVDSEGATSGRPIDATGEFTFEFETYSCPDQNRETCRLIDVPRAIVSNEITLQTTVEVVDDTKDSPRVYLKKVHGEDPEIDIRNGIRPGVSHLEQVTVETHFFPEYLRTNLEMELTLFMVCVGRQYRDTPNGCLSAPVDEYYIAYVSPYFYYRYYDPLDSSSFTDLYYYDLISPSQTLDSHQYIHEDEIHRSVFTNKALSALSREYTITNVFRLVERTDRRRRRKSANRRDIRDNVDNPVAVNQAIFFNGCPPNSTYDSKNLDCICIHDDEVYSTTFKCENQESARVMEAPQLVTEDARTPSTTIQQDVTNRDEGSCSTILSWTPMFKILVTVLSLITLTMTL